MVRSNINWRNLFYHLVSYIYRYIYIYISSRLIFFIFYQICETNRRFSELWKELKAKTSIYKSKLHFQNGRTNSHLSVQWFWQCNWLLSGSHSILLDSSWPISRYKVQSKLGQSILQACHYVSIKPISCLHLQYPTKLPHLLDGIFLVSIVASTPPTFLGVLVLKLYLVSQKELMYLIVHFNGSACNRVPPAFHPPPSLLSLVHPLFISQLMN